VNLMWFVSEG